MGLCVRNVQKQQIIETEIPLPGLGVKGVNGKYCLVGTVYGGVVTKMFWNYTVVC